MIEPYYEQDGITIYNADCEQVLPQLGRFDLLLTDPPYGIGASRMTLGSGQSAKPKSERFVKSDWDARRPSVENFLLLSDGFCVWGGNYFTDIIPPTNDWLVWHKKNDGRSFSECELAVTNFGKNVRHLALHWSAEVKHHPTQKPLPLMRWCLSFAPNAKTILDPFMGSGTTLLAAKLEGRQAVGIEISRDYCDIAIKRLQQKVLF